MNQITKFLDAITPEIYWLGGIFMFFFVLWLTLSDDNNIWKEAHYSRKIIFYPSLLLFCISWGMIDSELRKDFMTNSSIIIVTIIQLLQSIAASSITIEAYRSIKKIGNQWTERKHYLIMIVLIVSFFAISMFGLLHGRQSASISST